VASLNQNLLVIGGLRTYIRMVPDAPSPALLKTEVRLQLPPGWGRFISPGESWRAADLSLGAKVCRDDADPGANRESDRLARRRNRNTPTGHLPRGIGAQVPRLG
jgi:hypothetical protein